MDLEIRHEPNESRFVADVDGTLSILQYADQGAGVLDYQSTFVPPELRRRGIASQLVKYALHYARDNAYQIIPTCWFVKQIIDNEPEYADLVAP